MRFFALSFSFALLLPGIGSAQTFVETAPGVEYLQRVDPGPNRVSALRIDLCQSGLRVRATAEAERGSRTSDWADGQANMVAAINGGFFRAGFLPDGQAAGAGSIWSTSVSPASRGYLAFGRHQVEHQRPGALPSWAEEAINGDATLVSGGSVVNCGGCGGGARAPRTAVGYTSNKRYLYLVVVDGRSSSSIGMTIDELAVLMGGFGVERAMNVDGGGSSTMWLEGSGVVNRPSDGSERVVGNHLGVVVNSDFPQTDFCTSGRQFAFRGSTFEGRTIRGTAGSIVVGELHFENMGSIGWGARVALAPLPRDVASPFATPDWVSPTRVSVSPGGITTGQTTSFPFSVRIPDAVGTHEMPMSMVFRNNTTDLTIWFGDSWGPRDGRLVLNVISESPPPAPDASVPDASVSDASVLDGGFSDGGFSDTSVPGMSDANAPDSSTPSDGGRDGGPGTELPDTGDAPPSSMGGCSASASAPPAPLLFGFALILFVRRRTP